MSVQPIKQRLSVIETNQKEDINLSWSLEHLNKLLSLIGCSLPAISVGPKSHSSRVLQCFCFLLNASFQTWLVVHILVNSKFVSSSYIAEVSTSVVSWNFIIDNVNLAVYAIGGHGFLLFLTRPSVWLSIKDSFKLLEKKSTTIDVYPKCRRFTIYALIYITLAVIICPVID